MVRSRLDVVPRILLVDDEPSVLRDYAQVLARVAEVVTASDGEQALAHVANGSFDVIVSDIAMPHMNGVQLLKRVRVHDLDVPVVLITGQPSLQSAVDAVEYGAFRYLAKPVDMETLWSTVRRAYHVRQMAVLRREALALEGSEGRLLGDRAALEARFQNALGTLWVAYQPIVSWRSRSVIGYEALVRSDEPSLPDPRDLLDAAERLHRAHELGRSMRNLVAETARASGDLLFFVNIAAADLNDFALYSTTDPLALVADRIVLEITERVSLDSVRGVGARAAKLRDLGFRIGLDNLGAGYVGLSSFALLEPDFVKLDRSLVKGIDRSQRKLSVVRTMLRLCGGELSMHVICEGVETAAERDALADAGGDLLQGLLFGRPERTLEDARW